MKSNATTLRLMQIFAATAVLALFTSFRISQAGDWFPPLPPSIAEGAWSGTNSPIPAGTLELLGNPRGESSVYQNPFGEGLNASVITASSFDAYHDPTVCSTGQGFFLKAESRPEIVPGRRVRAMMMENPTSNLRALYYYWLQNEDGSTATEARMGTYRDVFARLQTGLGAVVLGHKTCLVRVFAFVPDNDKDGVQTHRNVLQVSRAIYHYMNKDNQGMNPRKIAMR